MNNVHDILPHAPRITLAALKKRCVNLISLFRPGDRPTKNTARGRAHVIEPTATSQSNHLTCIEDELTGCGPIIAAWRKYPGFAQPGRYYETRCPQIVYIGMMVGLTSLRMAAPCD